MQAAASPDRADALATDLSLLSLLLARNRPQHRRCLYYRRLSLARAALARLPPSHAEAAAAAGRWRALAGALREECGDGDCAKDRKRRRREEQWTLEGEGGGAGGDASTSREDDESLRRVLQEMAPLLAELRDLVLRDIPQVVSRILHAAAPVLHELSRGYHVPFLAACLACIARIRALLLGTGRTVAEALRETVPRVREILRKMKGSGGRGGEGNREALEEVAMPAFASAASPSGMTKPLPSEDEWNDLMAQFVEIGHDELAKKMNEFVREKRLEDATAKLGFGGRAVLDSPEPQAEKYSEDRGSNGGECNDVHSDSASDSRPAEETGTDTGELVGDVCDSVGMDGGDEADANARLLQRTNERRREPALSASESSATKKRKRKRGKASDEKEESPVGATRMEGGNQGRVTMNTTVQIHDAKFNDATREKEAKKKKKKKAKRQKRKSSSVIDDIFGS